MASIHVVARQQEQTPDLFWHEGVFIFVSGWWKINEEKVASLMGGTVFLHETKLVPSRMGGTILDIFPAPEGGPYEGRFAIRFQSTLEARFVAWNWGDNAPNMLAELTVNLDE